MGFMALFNAYTMRVCLSLTITEMVIPINKTHLPSNDEEVCPSEPTESSQVNSTSGVYAWDESTQGIILSSFYWGYVLTHLPGGMLSEKFGGKYSLGLGILSTSIFTLLTPLAVQIGDSTALIIVRILMGLGEGVTFPALNTMVFSRFFFLNFILIPF